MAVWRRVEGMSGTGEGVERNERGRLLMLHGSVNASDGALEGLGARSTNSVRPMKRTKVPRTLMSGKTFFILD